MTSKPEKSRTSAESIRPSTPRERILGPGLTEKLSPGFELYQANKKVVGDLVATGEPIPPNTKLNTPSGWMSVAFAGPLALIVTSKHNKKK